MKKIIICTVLIFIALPVYAINWPLKICGSGSTGYLCDQDDVPFLVVGGTAWAMAGGLSPSGVVTYLDDRRSKGYTVIILSATERYFSTNAPNNYNNDAPFTNGVNDWSVRNSAYWEHLDYILTQAKNREIAVFLFPAYLGYNCGSEGWCQNMLNQSNADMTSYGEFIGNRYATQGNIIWVAGGDRDCVDTTNLCDRVFAIHEAIDSANGDNGYHLQTAMGAGDPAMYSYNETWLDINTVYTDTGVASAIQTEYERSGAKPLNYIEATYENEYSSTAIVWQRNALMAYLGGALVGHFFGSCPIWCFDYCFTFCDNGSYEWADRLSAEGSLTMSYIGELMRSRDWWKLVPDYSDTVVTAGKGSGINYHATAVTTDDKTIMVWCPDTTQITVDMSELSGSNAKAYWWDPDDNSYTIIGTYATSGSRNFTPSQSGVVLVIDDTQSKFGPPGEIPVTGANYTIKGGTVK